MNETLDARRTLVASLIDAMPEPVLVVGESVRLIAANGPARGLFPASALYVAARLQPAGGRPP